MSGEAGVLVRHSLKRDLSRKYPWASSAALDRAVDLVTAQLDKYEDQPTYTMERFESARAAGEKLAAIVGSAPAFKGYGIERRPGPHGGAHTPEKGYLARHFEALRRRNR